MRVAHDPVGEVLDELVAELHLLAEGQVVAARHHRLDELAEFRLDVDGVHGRIQVADVAHDGQHHALDAGHAQVLGRLVGLVLQHVLHDEDDVLDELRVRLVDHHLARVVEELFYQRLDLVEEDRVERRRHLVAHQFLDVLLDLRAELFVGAQQQPQQVAHERRHRAVLHVLQTRRNQLRSKNDAKKTS